MPTHLKAYTPSQKGKELIAILFPMNHTDREKSMVKYWKQYPRETNAILDGFHFIILELIDERNSGETEETFNLPDELLNVIFRNMWEKKNYFSYLDGKDFLNALNGLKPPIFKNPEKIVELLENAVTQKKPGYVSKFNLPDQFDETISQKVIEICRKAETWYDNILKTLPSIQNSQKLMARLQNDKSQIAMMDMKLATETLTESRKNYTLNAGEIAQNWPYIHDVFRKYQDEVLVYQVYLKYLAKLLASREARYPVENYLLHLANGPFNLEVPSFEPTDMELQHNKTKVTLRLVYLKQLNLDISRLECRYRKRKLMVKLKEKMPKSEVIKELLEIAHIDPQDIKTHILLARMFGEYSLLIQNHQKRTSMREQALKYCNLAFTKIDEYLDLQNIQIMKERDLLRAGFVKSISTIRIPLIRKK